MHRVMKKPELTEELAERTGYYKKSMKEVVDALADIIIEHFETATYDEPAELQLAPGVLICGRRVEEHEAKDPRTGETITTPEKVIPYAVFRSSIRQKLRKQ